MSFASFSNPRSPATAPPPPASTRVLPSTSGRGVRRDGLDKRLIQTIIVDSRWKSIQPTPAAFSVGRSRADDSISLFSPLSSSASSTSSSFSPPSPYPARSPRHPRRRPFLAPPIVVGPLVPPFLELESSIAPDSIASRCIERTRGRIE